MDSNQTIQLKPVYPHSHLNLYNAPVINATIPNLSGLNIVGTSNGQVNSNHDDINNLNALATIQSNSSAAPITNNTAQIVPISANGFCLNNIQLQQIQMQQKTFSHNQSQAQFNKNYNGQIKVGPVVQYQIASPSNISTVTTNPILNGVKTSSGTIDQINDQIPIKSGSLSDTSSNSSSASFKSTLPEQNQSEILNSSLLIKNVNQKDMEQTNRRFVNLTKASCSNNSAITMRLSSSNGNVVNHVKSSNGKGFSCQICNRDFTQKGNLKTHLMTHSGERPYECQTCGKNFTQKGNLDTHVKIHTETKDHKCQYCDRGFTQRGNLKTHIRSIHTKEKPYACGHCGKAFSQKGNMLTHYRTHDKEARFPCNICGKTFSQKGNLKTHQQRHGRNSAR